jgi:hypothetical protein
MAEVARKLQDGESGVGPVLIEHDGQRAIHASIIDVDHLPIEAIEATAHLSKATLQLPQVFFLIVDGYDDIELQGEPLFSFSACN